MKNELGTEEAIKDGTNMLSCSHRRTEKMVIYIERFS